MAKAKLKAPEPIRQEGFLEFSPEVLNNAELVTLRFRIDPPNGNVYLYTSGSQVPTIICRGPERTITVGAPRNGIYARAAGYERYTVEVLEWSRGTAVRSSFRGSMPARRDVLGPSRRSMGLLMKSLYPHGR